MARRKYREALDILGPVAEDVGLERTFPRQASYLMGLCAEELGETEAAVNYYDRTARRYDNSHEAVAANLRSAVLLQAAGRNEEALEAYRQAMRTVRRPEDFRNRWLSLADFRRAVLDAWNGWVEDHVYQEAIDLAKLMPPLVSTAQAAELEARANQLWAEHLERRLDAAPWSERQELERELRMRWRHSGQAWDELARLLMLVHDALDHRVVSEVDGVDQQPPQPWEREHRLRDHGAAEELGQAQADDGDQRDQGIAKGVAEEDDALLHPLRPGSRHVVLVHHLQHRRTSVAHDERRLGGGQHRHR
jgi:tetratricopeptide (TPR) repeat protein